LLRGELELSGEFFNTKLSMAGRLLREEGEAEASSFAATGVSGFVILRVDGFTRSASEASACEDWDSEFFCAGLPSHPIEIPMASMRSGAKYFIVLQF